MKLKLLFAGTPDFSVPSLQSLINNHHVLAILTQPDSPTGRGRKLQFSPIKKCALSYQIPVLQPKTLNDYDIQKIIKNYNPDLMIVVAYGTILPAEILNIPKYGCVNIHASILPKFRGAAPIHRAILAGDKQTGISIMQMDEGLDTGDIIETAIIDIHDNETTQELTNRLSKLGSDTIINTLCNINHWHKKKQNNNHATYAEKITKKEAIINWHQATTVIYNKIRAFNNYPVACSKINGVTIRIWVANKSLHDNLRQPGTILTINKKILSVATKDGSIEIIKLQIPGKKPVKIADFINANHLIKVGDKFE